MEHNKLIDEINRITDDKFGFNLRSAKVNRRTCLLSLEILYNDGIMLDKETREKTMNKIEELLPSRYDFQVEFIKNFVGEDFVKQTAEEFLTHNYPAIFSKVKKVKSSEKNFDILLSVDELSFDYALNKDITQILSSFLKDKFVSYNFSVQMEKNLEESVAEVEQIKYEYKQKEEDQNSVRRIEYEMKEMIFGREFLPPARYIKDIVEPQEEIVICGKLKSLKIYDKKPKVQEQETQEKRRQRTLVKWVIEGFTGNMNCVFFAGSGSKAKLLGLEDGAEIAVRGTAEISKYSGEIEFLVRDLCSCTLPTDFKEQFVFHLEKPFYEFIKPAPVVSYAQDDLMSFRDVKSVPKYLQNKTFVCYDLETTGTSYVDGDKIIEIGAVKIENGKITESFSAMVNPERHISEGASKVNNIYDDDVKDAYKDYQVLQDFYKFVKNSILIGYNNINFDNVFLVGQGKSCRWNFEQPTEDVYKIAQNLVHGVKNYKLGTIAAKLGVPLENAHRAVYDATATAEVFIKLAEIMETSN